MTGIDPELLEQLSAWMDGELPADQARFLQRRLESDPELRAQWERWQLASACLRGQHVAAMPEALAPAIAAAIAREPRRRGPWAWTAAAAALVLVAVLLPGRPDVEPGPAPLAQAPTSSPVPATARDATAAEAGVAAGGAARPPVDELVAFATPTADGAVSPLPSVGDFPLIQGERRPWPRSPLATEPQQLEAYLVGHNTLMAEDGLGGFMPYVDVVAHDGDPELAEGEEIPVARNPDGTIALAGDEDR